MTLSLTGVAGLSKSNIGGGVRRLHGPVSEHAGAAVNSVTNFDRNLCVLGKPDVHAGAETDEADAFTALDGFTGFFPGDDAASDEASDLLEFDVATGSRERKDVLFVLCGGFGVPGGKELARQVFYLGDRTSQGCAIDVNIPNREEDADSRAGAARVFFGSDDDDAPVGG